MRKRRKKTVEGTITSTPEEQLSLGRRRRQTRFGCRSKLNPYFGGAIDVRTNKDVHKAGSGRNSFASFGPISNWLFRRWRILKLGRYSAPRSLTVLDLLYTGGFNRSGCHPTYSIGFRKLPKSRDLKSHPTVIVITLRQYKLK